MKKSTALILLILWACASIAQSQMKATAFRFDFEGLTRAGFIYMPGVDSVKTLIILIPGDGPTNIASGMYQDISRRMVQMGVGCLVWDKIGCGASEGEYTGTQTIQNSAEEVLAAIANLKSLSIEGIEHIGLWSISRGGWVAPLVLDQDPSLDFWISVSGADDKDNNTYLLQQNLRIIGRSKGRVRKLIKEYQAGNRIYWGGGTYQDFLTATQNIRVDPYKIKIHGESYTSKADYERDQNKYRALYQFDPVSARIIMVPNFSSILKRIDRPVLAIFGRKDAQINWKQTKKYYRNNLGSHPQSKLKIISFKNCGHVLYKCDTCGLDNRDLQKYQYQPCDGYYQAMSDWLGHYDFSD